VEFKLLKADDLDVMEDLIINALSDGWTLYGEFHAAPWTRIGLQQFLYIQPMVRHVVNHERYPMCKDQQAQIDCRVTTCRFNAGAGQCTNVSPAITLNTDKSFVCWSQNANFKEED